MKRIILKLIVAILNIVYIPIKLFPIKKQVTFLSRQSNTPGIDIRMLAETISNIDSSASCIILAKKTGETKWEKLKFCFHVIKQMYYISTSKVVVIDGYCPAISILKHKKMLRVIQIWHAAGAVKMFGYQVIDKEEGYSRIVAESLKMHKNYNLVTCVSEATKKYFTEAFNVDDKDIKILGMPRIDYIKNLKVNRNDFYERYPQYRNKKIILYAPTFRKNEDIDFDSITKYIRQKDYALIIKKHPLDKRVVSEEFCVGDEYDTYQLLKIADFIITDYSALGIEASLLGKPIFFYLYDYDSYIGSRGVNIELKTEMSQSVYYDFSHIMDKIESGEYDFQQLDDFKNKYIETTYFNNTEKIASAIFEYIKEDFFE